MESNLSRAFQDYLKAIYRLSNRYGKATTSKLAEWLNVKPATVTGMLQKLSQADPPLIRYRKHQGATLTSAGESAALELVRNHRLLELFLHEKLGYSWDEVHDEAEQLEHVISKEMELRMAAILGNPGRDPHGDPIPDNNLQLKPVTEFPLSELCLHQEAVVRRVRDESPEFLRRLDLLNLRPFVTLTAVSHNLSAQTITIHVAGQSSPVTIGLKAARNIFVDILPA